MGRYTVYAHILPNKKIYVGITSVGVDKRSNNGKGYIKNKEFYCDILLYGWENVLTLVLFEAVSRGFAARMEVEYIRKWGLIDNGYNKHYGGVCTEHTQATKDKLSVITKERWAKGELKSRVVKDSEREKHSKSVMGGKNHNAKPISQYDMMGNFIKRYDCVADAGKAIRGDKHFGSIFLAARNKTSKAYGYKWKYD